MTTPVAVTVWLGAIVAANLTVAAFGPGITIVNAFLLIGLDLSLRDHLHDRWSSNITTRMGALIAAGGALSWLLNPAAGQIAVASTVAFTAAAVADTAVYTAVRRWRPWTRMNTSNLAGAAVDSMLFPTIAFGGVMWGITVGQFAAKVAGGAAWAAIIIATRRRQVAA